MTSSIAFSSNNSAFSLPGAWPSTDSLQETLGLENPNPLQEPLCAGVLKRKSPHNATAQKSLRNSVASYDDDSDDFYSFVETQAVSQTCLHVFHTLTFSFQDDDEEGALPPNDSHISGVCSYYQSRPSDGFLLVPLFQLPGPIKSGSIISENPACPSLAHTDSSDDTSSSSQKITDAPDTPLSIPFSDVPSSPQSDCDYPHVFLSPLTIIVSSTPRTSLVTSSSKQSINSVSSSSGSARLGDEEFSHHLDHSEDESASYTQAFNAIDPGPLFNNSEESLPIHIRSSPSRARRSLQIQRRVIVNQDSLPDILHLAQPDGHNPWTLNLEPTLLNLSGLASTSRSSISIESSSITQEIPRDASPERRSETPVSPRTPTAQSFATAQNESRSGVGHSRVDLRPAPPPSYSAYTIPHATPKKDVVQKTKNFYQKMKRFFTPKSSKPNESRGISNEMSNATPRNASSSALPFSSPYSNESSSQWSLNRRAFRKSAKSSAPSVTLSCTPDIQYGSTYHLPPGVTHDARRTLEYRRPTSPAVRKSNDKRIRRFSVPTPFHSSTLAPTTSSPKNINVPSSRPFGKSWSRITE